MKKMLSIILILAFAGVLLAGCTAKSDINGTSSDTGAKEEITPEKSDKKADSTSTAPKYKTLNVGILVGSSAMPILYARDQGWFEEAGLDVNVITFPTGAPINEAFAADQLDIASYGAAGIFAMSTGECTMIGEPNTAGGLGLFVREDSPLLEHQGENTVYPDALGSADTAKGLKTMLPLGTAAQYILLQWAKGFGLGEADIEQIHMEYPSAYQAFSSGEGDAVLVSPPYYFNCINDGYTEVSGFDQDYYTDMVIARNEILEDRGEEVTLFLQAFYRACEALTDDELRTEYSIPAFADLGAEYTKETMAQEISVRKYIDKKYMEDSAYEFASWLLPTAEFYVTTEKLTADQVDIVKNAVDLSYVEKALKIDLSGTYKS